MSSTLEHVLIPTNDERLAAICETLRAIQPTPLAETRVLCAGRVDEDAAWLREHGYLVEEIEPGHRDRRRVGPGSLPRRLGRGGRLGIRYCFLKVNSGRPGAP